MFVRASLALLLTLSACSSDTNSSNPVDAATSDTGSGNSNSVQKVTCPATVALTVTTIAAAPNGAYAYAPSSANPTIAVGDIVHFQLASSHNAVPAPNKSSDPGLNVGFGGDACLKFTKVGTFNFYCSAHTFYGAITVQ